MHDRACRILYPLDNGKDRYFHLGGKRRWLDFGDNTRLNCDESGFLFMNDKIYRKTENVLLVALERLHQDMENSARKREKLL